MIILVEILPDALGFGGRLIDDGSAIDDINEPSGNDARVCGERAEPDRNDRRFAEPCRQHARLGEIAPGKAIVELALPGKRLVTRERLKRGSEVDDIHFLSPYALSLSSDLSLLIAFLSRDR